MSLDFHNAQCPCCSFHFLGGAFAVGRSTCGNIIASEAASFSDSTPSSTSEHCVNTIAAAQDLIDPALHDRITVIKNTTVLTMTGAGRLVDHDVYIRGAEIVEVAISSAPPEGARIIDGHGMFLIPGLTDIHTHPMTLIWAKNFLRGYPDCSAPPEDFTLPSGLLLFQFLAAGVTRIEIMAGDPDAIYLRDAVANGSVHGPKISVGTPLVDGPIPVMSPLVSWLCADAEGGTEAARQAHIRGFDFVKPYTNLPAEAFKGLTRECQQLGLRLMGHVPKAVGIADALSSGQQGIAHSFEYFHNLSGPERFDLGRIAALATETKKRGAFVQSTARVAALMERMMAKGDKAADLCDLSYSNPLFVKSLDPESDLMRDAMHNEFFQSLLIDIERLSYETVRLLNETGVRILSGTDAPGMGMSDGFGLHDELETLVENCGLTTSEALKSSTTTPAEYHGEGDRAGVIRPGANANLVLLQSDPLESITAVRSVDTVISHGAVLTPEKRRIGLERLRKAYADMPSLDS